MLHSMETYKAQNVKCKVEQGRKGSYGTFNFHLSTFNARRFASRGFTLVEMIVAIGLFAVVMVVAGGSLLSIIDANRKAQSVKSIMNNLNFALENMARNLRVGTDYHCGSVGGNLSIPADCTDYATSVAFRSSSGATVIYALNDGRVVRSENGGLDYTPLTAPEISIDDLRFYVTGTSKNDGIQPRVLMIVGGEFVTPNVRFGSRFDLQTLITQRATDLE